MIVPRFTQERCVILSDGGIESLIATAMSAEQQQLSGHQPSMLLPGWWEWTTEIDLMVSAVDPAVVKQAQVFGVGVFPHDAIYPAEDHSMENHQSASLQRVDGMIQSQLLLEAAATAMRHGFRKLVWPVRAIRPEYGTASAESVVDEISATVDRALLVSRLASLNAQSARGHESGDVVDLVIETPFVDLTNQQIRDLAIDLAVPMETCWWADGRSLPQAEARAGFWKHGLPISSNESAYGILEPKSSFESTQISGS